MFQANLKFQAVWNDTDKTVNLGVGGGGGGVKYEVYDSRMFYLVCNAKHAINNVEFIPVKNKIDVIGSILVKFSYLLHAAGLEGCAGRVIARVSCQ